jgi:hypothetical protein
MRYVISPIGRFRQAPSCSSSSAAARLTWVDVMSRPQSSWTMAVTFRVLTPWTYISATARVIARSLRTPRSSDRG